MGLPEIVVEFQTKASTAIQRSERGIVAIVLGDDTDTTTTTVFNKASDVKEGFTEDNIKLIQSVFLGNPNKVIVVRVETSNPDYAAALDVLKRMKFNYLVVPGASSPDATNVVTWIKDCRKENKTFKAVLANTAANHEGIINFTTDQIKLTDKTYTSTEYTPRIAGILAGLSLNRSATYYVLDEVISIEEKTDPSTNIDDGELILINDGEKIKIARGVNSLKDIPESKSSEMKKIKIIEGMDLILEDIITSFNDAYVGKVINNYDNKQLFFASVNGYFLQLMKDGVLDRDYKNVAQVDIEAHISILEQQGIDITTMSDIAIKKLNTGSKLYAVAGVKFVDAMEDLQFIINM